mmetsp:Transcript_9166/g.27595  ORF Transcript_9166/g.27595 Transcript_9166/m.27595 type:complete len:216 (-) Transcript_9166:24-671(-)
MGKVIVVPVTQECVWTLLDQLLQVIDVLCSVCCGLRSSESLFLEPLNVLCKRFTSFETRVLELDKHLVLALSDNALHVVIDTLGVHQKLQVILLLRLPLVDRKHGLFLLALLCLVLRVQLHCHKPHFLHKSFVRARSSLRLHITMRRRHSHHAARRKASRGADAPPQRRSSDRKTSDKPDHLSVSRPYNSAVTFLSLPTSLRPLVTRQQLGLSTQ